MSRNLDDWISNYVKYTDESEAAEVFRRWVAISSVAAALERKVWVNWSDLWFYPNLFVILIGPSGSRKNTAITPARKMLNEIDIVMAAQSSTREELMERFDTGVQINPDGVIGEHASITMINEELYMFLGEENKELIQDLTGLYDSPDEFEKATKTQGKNELVNVCFNLLGGMTPNLMQDALPKFAIEGGFAGRTMFIYQESKGKIVPIPVKSQEQERLKQPLIEDLQEINQMKGEMKQTESWMEEYARWCEEEETGGTAEKFLGRKLKAYGRRRREKMIKLCIISSASRNDELVIREEDFWRAKDFLEEAEERMKEVFEKHGGGDLKDIVERVAGYVARKGEVKKSRLLSEFYAEFDSTQQADDVISFLEEIGAAQVVRKGGDVTVQKTDPEP